MERKGLLKLCTFRDLLRYSSNLNTLFSLLSFILFVIIISYDGRRSSEKTVEATAFVLKGKDGAERAALRALDDGTASLTFLGSDNQPRLSLVVSENDSATLNMLDRNGMRRLTIGMNPVDSSTINLSDAKGNLVLAMASLSDGGGGLYFKDMNGMTRMQLRVDNERGPSIIMCDEKRERRIVFYFKKDGEPMASILSDKPRPR